MFTLIQCTPTEDGRQMDYIVTLEKEVKIICSHLVRSSY